LFTLAIGAEALATTAVPFGGVAYAQTEGVGPGHTSCATFGENLSGESQRQVQGNIG
jgi:hypothetical protein